MKCPKCKTKMKRIKGKPITPKRLKQKYLFTQWDACPQCPYIQHYEKYKIETYKLIS